MIDLKKLRANMAASLRLTLDPDSRLTENSQRLMIPGRSGEIEVFFHPGMNPKSPVVFELHGGGFAFGDASQSDALCEHLRRDLEIALVSVNYRRSPRYPFPAALEDVYDAILYFYSHAFVYGIDPDRMAVFGHSAGGNLTAAVSILARRTGEFPLCAQLMTYPYLNLAENPFDKPSAAIRWFLPFWRSFPTWRDFLPPSSLPPSLIPSTPKGNAMPNALPKPASRLSCIRFPAPSTAFSKIISSLPLPA